MKKVLSITLAALLTLTLFSACKTDDSTFSNIIKDSINKTSKLTDFTATIINEAEFNSDKVFSTKVEKDYRVHNKGISTKFEMSEETTVTSLTNTSEYELYYKDGKMYTNRYGGNFVSKIDSKDTEYLNYSPLIDIKYEDMKSVTKGSNNDSSEEDDKNLTVISFECNRGAMTEIAKSTIGGDGESYEDIKVVSAKGEYKINDDGYIIHQNLIIDVKIVDDGIESNAKAITTVKFENVGEDVNPYDPDEDTYYEIDDINVAASLFSAMASTLNSSELEIKYEGTASIKQDDIDASYKREYHKIYSDSNEQLYQTTNTDYFEFGKKTNTLKHGQYYKDGVYSNRNDSFKNNIYSKMDYPEFMVNMFAGLKLSPVDYLTPGMMKELESKTEKDNTVYTFSINAESEEGVQFIGSLFGAFVNFGGDVATAKVKVNSFSGKSYVNKQGFYIKSEIECDIDVEFEEGKVNIKSSQTIDATNTANVKGLKYPDTSDYKYVSKADLFGAVTK